MKKARKVSSDAARAKFRAKAAAAVLSSAAYANNGKDYVIGYTSEKDACHMFDGDSLGIKSAGLGNEFIVTYVPNLSKCLDEVFSKHCVLFWASAKLAYNPKLGILSGTARDQVNQGGDRWVSIALDRSRSNPSVVHIYVSERLVDPPQPDDGSATGTGGK